MNQTIKCSVCESNSNFIEEKNNTYVYCCENCGTFDVVEK